MDIEMEESFMDWTLGHVNIQHNIKALKSDEEHQQRILRRKYL